MRFRRQLVGNSRLLVVLLIAIASSSCSISFGELQVAESGVTRFREYIGAGRIAEYYDDSPQLRDIVGKDKFVACTSLNVEKLGTLQEAVLAAWNVEAHSNGRIVSLVYHSSFQRGKGKEEFAFLVLNKEASLVGYYLTSDSINSEETKKFC